MTKNLKALGLLMLLMSASPSMTQGIKPLPSLHTEGRYVVDKHGNHVVLHGVMDTPNMYFNGWRWGSPWTDGTNYDDAGAEKCLDYFEKVFTGLEQAKCTVFRLHLDPAWTNDPNDSYVYSGSVGQAADATNEADIKKFNPERLKHFLPTLYLKLAEKAMNHGMYVVVRPPGVCPGSLKVGDYYQAYLKYVWDVFSQQDFVKEHAGQISIELANEPVVLNNASNQDDPKALHDYFQPIVNKIRDNGFTGIIWAPGTTWQQNYRSYVEYPIEGENIGYAVHDYCGWYGSSDDTPDPQLKINKFHESVPVVDFAPIIITEVDWSPENPNAEGHYNESGTWVLPNYGTWATGSTSKWGKAYKANIDYLGNVWMTLGGSGALLDVDKLLSTGQVYPAFNGLPEACGKACMDWYAEYYQVDWPHADDEAETGDFYTVKSLEAEKTSFDLMIGENVLVQLKAVYADGHTKVVSTEATYDIDKTSVLEVKNGYLCALAAGEAKVKATYTDKKGKKWEKSFTVKVTGTSMANFTELTSLSDILAKPFMIMNKDTEKIIFGSDNQNLGYESALKVINDKTINGYLFKAEAVSGRSNCYYLRLITLAGTEYNIWGSPGYLNSQPATGSCCFILGLKDQDGQDIKDGAVWEIKYDANNGFSLKNMGTGKYLKDNTPARYDTPANMKFYKAGSTSGIHDIRVESFDSDAVYNLQGVRIGTKADMEHLPRGIYIIGGKKIIK